MTRKRDGATLVEASLAVALAGLLLAFLAGLAAAATPRAGEATSRSDRAALSRIEVALRRDLRRAAGGARHLAVAPGGDGFDVIVLEPGGERFARGTWRYERGRLLRDGRPLSAPLVRSFTVSVAPAFVPGEPARIQIELRTDGGPLSVVDVLPDGEVLP
jgi:hypothetical protein